MQNESLRSRFVGIVVSIVLVVFLSFVYFNYELFEQNFNNRVYWFSGIFLLIFLGFRGFLVSYFVKVVYKKRQSIPRAMQFFNVFFEISIPSAVIVLFALQVTPYNSLLSPLTQIYFIMIVLTIMEMDMAVSTFAGILSGVEFFFISIYFASRHEPPRELALIGTNMYYFGRSMLMVATGVIAGYLAERIKKNAINFYSQQEEMRKIELLFGQQLSPQIARRLLESTSLSRPEKHEACIMFLDIRDFTRITENMSPEQIISFQNHIFSDMFRIVNNHNGVVNQVMGDGFMATFGAPVNSDKACAEAVNCGLALLQNLKEVKNDHDFPETKVGIGMHFGSVVTGNIGTEERRQFSITGQTVIIASRIEQLNKVLGTQLLISENVQRQLNGDGFRFSEYGKHEIKGLSQPISIFSLL